MTFYRSTFMGFFFGGAAPGLRRVFVSDRKKEKSAA
jgi:hypothetical protein